MKIRPKNLKFIHRTEIVSENQQFKPEREITMSRFTIVALLAGLIFGLSSLMNAQNKYVGASQCKMCHNTEKQGKQFDIWSKSKHAQAYKTLLTKEAEIATKKGFKTKAVETPECLGCHTITADAKLLDKKFDVKDGVQCESCHGAGSEYKSMATMKDAKKAEKAGLMMFADEKAATALCVTCHNEKSPTAKKFDYAKMWPQIEHMIPKK
jgi:hypothetical protein